MLLNILNSNFITSLVTLLVGVIAVHLYLKQKNDHKRDAANIILMEIRHAEHVIDSYKVNGISLNVSFKLILPTSNWNKYNYLFIKKLDVDEIELINNFYNNCLLIDEALSQMSISVQLEQKSNAIHEVLSLISKDSISEEDFKQKKDKFLKNIEPDNYLFKPGAPLNLVAKVLNSINLITTSSAGNKLKDIAKLMN